LGHSKQTFPLERSSLCVHFRRCGSSVPAWRVFGVVGVTAYDFAKTVMVITDSG